jgi:hypothetical protein
MTVLFSTSEASYSKQVLKNGSVKNTKEAGDPEGPFKVGLYLQNTDTESEAVVLSGSYAFADSYVKLPNYINGSMLTNSVNYMAGAESVSTVRTISFNSAETITINAAQANGIAIVMVVVIPVVLLVWGVVVMLRRRNR